MIYVYNKYFTVKNLKPSEANKKKFRQGIKAFQKAKAWALFTKNSYKINLLFFLYYQVEKLNFRKHILYLRNVMFNSRTKRLKRKVI